MSEIQDPDNLLDMEIFNAWLGSRAGYGSELRARAPSWRHRTRIRRRVHPLAEEGLGIAVLANADGARSVIKLRDSQRRSRFPGRRCRAQAAREGHPCFSYRMPYLTAAAIPVPLRAVPKRALR
jgi:hypothetical protein